MNSLVMVDGVRDDMVGVEWAGGLTVVILACLRGIRLSEGCLCEPGLEPIIPSLSSGHNTHKHHSRPLGSLSRVPNR